MTSVFYIFNFLKIACVFCFLVSSKIHGFCFQLFYNRTPDADAIFLGIYPLYSDNVIRKLS